MPDKDFNERLSQLSVPDGFKLKEILSRGVKILGRRRYDVMTHGSKVLAIFLSKAKDMITVMSSVEGVADTVIEGDWQKSVL